MATKLTGGLPTRVMVADPHPVYRRGLANALARRSDLELVSEAGDANATVEQIGRLSPDVAVVELKLLAEDHRLLERIAEAEADVRVLLLCGREDPDDIYGAIEAGAVGCLFKEAEANEITEAIASVAHGEAVLAPRAAELIARQIRLRGSRDGTGLTDRECQVLALTADGFSSERVGAQLSLSQSTVKNHLSNVYAKLGVTSAAAAVFEAMRLGILG